MRVPDDGDRSGVSHGPRAVLLDLLMATMNSIETWRLAAGDPVRGLAWRDAVTRRMIAAGRYLPYEELVAETAAGLELDPASPRRLVEAWRTMSPWPDVNAASSLAVPHAFVTNCSAALADLAAKRSGFQRLAFTLSAQEAGWYKPRREIYLLACARLGFRPEEVRFVAGARYDAEGARAAGLEAVLVRRRPLPGGPPSGIPVADSLADAITG